MKKLNLIERTVFTYLSCFDINYIPQVEIIASDLSLNVKTTATAINNLLDKKYFDQAKHFDLDQKLELFNETKLYEIVKIKLERDERQIYNYLKDKPSNYKYTVDSLAANLNFGKDKTFNILSNLKKVGLL